MNKILHSILNNVFAYRVFKLKKSRSSLKAEVVTIADAIASESFSEETARKMRHEITTDIRALIFERLCAR